MIKKLADIDTCDLCDQPALIQWDIEQDKWGHSRSELNCSDCYDYHGYQYEQQGWTETDYEQEDCDECIEEQQ